MGILERRKILQRKVSRPTWLQSSDGTLFPRRFGQRHAAMTQPRRERPATFASQADHHAYRRDRTTILRKCMDIYFSM